MGMLKVYIAAPWVDRDDMRLITQMLTLSKMQVTHKWWEVESVEGEDKRSLETAQYQAYLDIDGVRRADVVLLINSKKSEGKAVEQGVAIALGKPIIAVGVRGDHSKNVFHYLPNYKWVPDLKTAFRELERMRG